jgi:hypothetical protein
MSVMLQLMAIHNVYQHSSTYLLIFCSFVFLMSILLLLCWTVILL